MVFCHNLNSLRYLVYKYKSPNCFKWLQITSRLNDSVPSTTFHISNLFKNQESRQMLGQNEQNLTVPHWMQWQDTRLGSAFNTKHMTFLFDVTYPFLPTAFKSGTSPVT